MSGATRVAALLLVVVLATMLAGWVGLTVAAFGAGFTVRPVAAALAAAMAWAAILGWRLLSAPDGALGTRLGELLQVPAWVLLAAVPVYAFLLAWSASVLSARFRPSR